MVLQVQATGRGGAPLEVGDHRPGRIGEVAMNRRVPLFWLWLIGMVLSLVAIALSIWSLAASAQTTTTSTTTTTLPKVCWSDHGSPLPQPGGTSCPPCWSETAPTTTLAADVPSPCNTSPACPVEGAGDCRSCPTVPNPYDACLSDDVPPWGDDPGTVGQPNGVNCLVTPEHEACPRGDDREQVVEIEPGRWCVIGEPLCAVAAPLPKFTG